MLLPGVVHQDIDASPVGHGIGHHLAAKGGVGGIAGQGDGPSTVTHHFVQGLFRVLVLVQIDQHHVHPFKGIVHRDGTADAAVAAGDDRHLAGQLAGGAIVVVQVDGLRVHFTFQPRLVVLVLRGQGFFLGHAGDPPEVRGDPGPVAD
ncbi:hypothetical protein D9M70_492620 [compost metagenome]